MIFGCCLARRVMLFNFMLVLIVAIKSGQSLIFVDREEWGAKPRKGTAENITEKVPYMFIHHTAMSECNDFDSCCAEMRKIQDFHMDNRGWDDIGYNFLVGGDGRIYVGRDFGVVGAHTYGYNKIGYGISFMGTFTNKLPNENAMEAVKELLNLDITSNYVQSDYGLYGHRDGRCTECPGDMFYEHLQTWNRWHAKGRLPNYYC